MQSKNLQTAYNDVPYDMVPIDEKQIPARLLICHVRSADFFDKEKI